MNIKALQKTLQKVDKGYDVIGQYGYRYYTIYQNDIEDNGKKYLLNISTLRAVILQTVFFDTAEEIYDYVSNVKLKAEKVLW